MIDKLQTSFHQLQSGLFRDLGEIEREGESETESRQKALFQREREREIEQWSKLSVGLYTKKELSIEED